MILTENMKILAGLQESKIIENPLPKLIEAEKRELFLEQERIRNAKKSVLGNFSIFQEKMEEYGKMINTILGLFTPENSKMFNTGLVESKYPQLQRFADIVINDDLTKTMVYMDAYYYEIKEELDLINKMNESINEDNAPSYFVARDIKSNDSRHHMNVTLFKYKTLDEAIMDVIPYGAQLIHISEKLTIIKDGGKKYYTSLSTNQIEQLEKNNFLI